MWRLSQCYALTSAPAARYSVQWRAPPGRRCRIPPPHTSSARTSASADVRCVILDDSDWAAHTSRIRVHRLCGHRRVNLNLAAQCAQHATGVRNSSRDITSSCMLSTTPNHPSSSQAISCHSCLRRRVTAHLFRGLRMAAHEQRPCLSSRDAIGASPPQRSCRLGSAAPFLAYASPCSGSSRLRKQSQGSIKGCSQHHLPNNAHIHRRTCTLHACATNLDLPVRSNRFW